MIEKLYQGKLGDYISRLNQASNDVKGQSATVEQAVDLYGVSKVDLCQLCMEKAEWNRYIDKSCTTHGYEIRGVRESGS